MAGKFEVMKDLPKREPPKPEPPQPQQVRKPPPRSPFGEITWHAAWRWLASLAIVLHLVAVFCAPWDLSTPAALPPEYTPPTDNQGRQLPEPPRNSAAWQEPVVPRALHRFFRHYLNLCYLNHGYEFFAPDPAGSNLIRYVIRDSGGKEIVQGEFPSHAAHWPRLLYHRHMMLAAQTGQMGEASGRQYARHLLTKHGGQSIRLDWILHRLVPRTDFLAGTPLNAPNPYQLLATIQESAGAQLTPRPSSPAVGIPGGGP
jgi:hypothetical protein